MIVGQGQLDQVLNARPEDRRAIIEEAAGVLKFRKRKEKAERRLDSTEGNLLRLTDLLREVRRQLRPLERQADAARRYDGLVTELRAARLYLAGQEIDQLRTRSERARSLRADLAQTEQRLRTDLRSLDARVVDAEAALSLPGGDDVADVLVRVEQLRERGRGLQALVAERLRGIDRELEAAADEGVVETLVADAETVRSELAAVDADFAALAPSRTEVENAESRVQLLREEIDAVSNMPSDATAEVVARREAEEAAELAAAAWRDARSEFDALERAAASFGREEPKLQSELGQARALVEQVEPERSRLESEEAAAEQARAEIDAATAIESDHTDTGRAVRAAEASLEGAMARLDDARSEASRWRARAETLQLALDEARAATSGDALRAVDGVVGPFVEQLVVDEGVEVAPAAALGDSLHAVVVDGPVAARNAVDALRRGDGHALMLVLGAGSQSARRATAPAGCRPIVECVRTARPELAATLHALVGNVVLAESWERALDVVLDDPSLVAVTAAGDRFGGTTAWRAGPLGRSAVTPAALDEAIARADAADSDRSAAEAEVRDARVALDLAKDAERRRIEALRVRRVEVDRLLDGVTRARRDFERRTAGLDERVAQLDARLTELRAGHAEVPAALERADETRRVAESALDDARQNVAAARRAELSAAEQLRQRRAELDRLRSAAAKLRRDFEVRGAAVEERRNVLTRRLDDIERRLAARPDEEAAAQRRRAQLTERQTAIGALGARLTVRLADADAVAERLRERRRVQSEAARAAAAVLDGLRSERAQAEKSLGEVRERLGRLDVEDAENKLRLETTVEQLRRDHDCEPEAALAASAPEVPENTTIVQHARELDRELRLMGPINPLALSEYEALVERHEFLQQQLDDVKNTRRELNRVIQQVNAEIVTVFEQAFTDVAQHFEALFALLFPGGSGRLFLSNPEDLLNTGVEVEARPSGKTPRRLSLLSGGERSLAALAYLFAVFRARPSPFYLLDEVEAALDEVNLHRFLDLVHEFRHEAQLLIVSHQKRTMESADVLYGVTMAPGASSRVASLRTRDLTLEDA